MFLFSSTCNPFFLHVLQMFLIIWSTYFFKQQVEWFVYCVKFRRHPRLFMNEITQNYKKTSVWSVFVVLEERILDVILSLLTKVTQTYQLSNNMLNMWICVVVVVVVQKGKYTLLQRRSSSIFQFVLCLAPLNRETDGNTKQIVEWPK